MNATVVATVTRAKQYPTPGKNFRFAWRWTYTITIPGKPPIGAGDLSEVKMCAKANGAGKIVKEWEG